MKNSNNLIRLAEGNIDVEEILEIIFHNRLRCAFLLSEAMNYELQTPLVIIRGLAESLLRKPGQNPQEHLREISREAGHLLKVIESMVFKNLSAEIQMESITLKPLVEQVSLYFEKACLEKGISIHIELDENLRVYSDANRLKTILIALIENAVESFTQSNHATKSITIHNPRGSDSQHLIVSDTGIGMSSEKQKLLKELMNSKKAQTDIKSGLGLALAYKLCKDLSIKLGVVSEPNHGSSFTLSF